MLSTGGGVLLFLLLWRSFPARAPWCLSSRPLPECHGPWSFLFLACWGVPAPVLRYPRCPVPVGACLLP